MRRPLLVLHLPAEGGELIVEDRVEAHGRPGRVVEHHAREPALVGVAAQLVRREEDLAGAAVEDGQVLCAWLRKSELRRGRSSALRSIQRRSPGRSVSQAKARVASVKEGDSPPP